MSAIPMPLWEAVEQYQAALAAKIGDFFVWLPAVEAKLDSAGIDAVVNVTYESPFTAGGPFMQVPKAIVTGTVLYRGFLARTEASGKEKERRGMTLGLQSMGHGADWVERNLTWYSRPESYYFPVT